MNTWRKTLIATVGLGLLVGCLPKKRIVWSPDGSMAAVITDRDLRFINGEGSVLPLRIAGAVEQCAWFPDGKKFVVVTSTKARRWDDLEKVLSEEQIAFIKDFAIQLRPRIMEYQGDWGDFKLSQQKHSPTSIEIAALIHLRDKLSEGLPEKLGEKWEDLQKLELDISRLQVFALEGSKLRAGLTLATSINDIRRPKVSPDGRLVAFLTQRWDRIDDAPALYVVLTEGGPSRLVAERVALGHDWSPDGYRLAFIRATSAEYEDESSVRLGVLTTATVAGPDGAPLDEPSSVDDRVGLIFGEALSVQWLTDGRLLFSSVELRLPATTRDMPQQWSLFVLDPRMSASVNRVLGRDFSQPLDAAIPLFELSPDETRVLLPGPKGHVTLYEFATGKSIPLVHDREDTEGKTRSLPSWRNSDEVCFISPGSANGPLERPAQVVIWKAGQTQVLSEDWPEDMKESWLVGD